MQLPAGAGAVPPAESSGPSRSKYLDPDPVAPGNQMCRARGRTRERSGPPGTRRRKKPPCRNDANVHRLSVIRRRASSAERSVLPRSAGGLSRLYRRRADQDYRRASARGCARRVAAISRNRSGRPKRVDRGFVRGVEHVGPAPPRASASPPGAAPGSAGRRALKVSRPTSARSSRVGAAVRPSQCVGDRGAHVERDGQHRAVAIGHQAMDDRLRVDDDVVRSDASWRDSAPR